MNSSAPSSIPRTSQFVRLLISIAALLATLGFLARPSAVAGDTEASVVRIESFQLTDQFGTAHHVDFPRSRPLLLLVGDRKGSDEIDPWIEPLKKRWSGVSDILGIADVDGIPRFFRSRVTEAIRKSRTKPLLLDFEGRVTRHLPCEKRTANLFAIDREGRVMAHVSGPYSAGTNGVAKLEVLERALAPPSSP